MPVWTIPMIYTAASLITAVIVPRVEHAFLPPIDIGISASSALSTLSAIASGMMALTGIVFSVAFVMLQFSAVTYSPRFAARFARDPLLFHSLGVFFATFVYALAASLWADREGSGRVPMLSLWISIVLLCAGLFTFVLLLRRLGDLQIGDTLRFIGDRGREVIRRHVAVVAPPGLADARPPAGPPVQVLRHDGAPRYVQNFDIPALVALARRAGAVVEMECAVGDVVTDGAPLLRVLGPAPIAEEAELRRAVQLGPERTFEQDPKYPIRLLVDVAIKALSPAINDPTTAVQALDQIEDLLRRLARHDLDAGRVADGEGALRLVFPTPSWEDYLALSFDEIRFFGATSVQVMRRLRAALLGLAELLEGQPRAEQVQRYLQRVDATIERSTFDEVDRMSARREDAQGLGLSR